MIRFDLSMCSFNRFLPPGLAYAFDKLDTLNLNTPYDYNSVMQYHRFGETSFTFLHFTFFVSSGSYFKYNKHVLL